MILYAYVANGGTLGEPTATIAYGYEVENQAWADQLTSYNGEAIRYDASGNPTTYRGYTMTWQGRRLTGATGNGNTLSYSYDENGLRTQKTVNGTATQYRYHGSVLISQVTGNDTLLFSYDANGNVVAVNYNGTYYYYVRNGQNDVIRLIDGNNNTVVEYSYDSWGRQISCTGSLASTLGTQNPFRYRGYVYDAETGLYYLQTRYYDPEVGRFINADMYVSTGQGVLGHNMYGYCLNNPICMLDDGGELPAILVGLAAAAGALKGIAIAAFETALTIAIVGLATSTIQNISESVRRERQIKQHTVYVLKAPSGEVEYVGRTKDYKARMNAHKNSHRGHLEPEVVADNLNYYEARVLEQEMMLKHHTINTLNNINNQINGISPLSDLGKAYVELKRGGANYLSNWISDRVYALFE